MWSRIPSDGTRTTRKTIFNSIPEENSYENVSRCVDYLRDAELVDTTQGGGVDRRLTKYPNEPDAYPSIRAEIETRWAEEPPHDYVLASHEPDPKRFPAYQPNRFCQVLISSKLSIGEWKAPDITLIGGKTLPYLPGKFLDVVTFEVKASIDIKGLYEALAHRASATHSYLLCYRSAEPGAKDDGELEKVGRITREAVRTGVGFILAGLPDDYGTWREIVPATRATPDPASLHDFVARQDYGALRKLRRWLRADPFLHDSSTMDVAAHAVASLDLTPDEKALAEDMYVEVHHRRRAGRTDFDDLGHKRQVDRIKKHLIEAGHIHTIQGGGIRPGPRPTDA